MECRRVILSIILGKDNYRLQEKDVDELIASCNGKCKSIINYSAKELIRATNKFDPHLLIMKDSHFKLYKGSSRKGHQILIKKYGGGSWSNDKIKFLATRDIMVMWHMDNHKNVLKLLGCCLEFEHPAFVYEYAGGVSLNDLLHHGHDDPLLWKSRLRIANDIASVVVKLQTTLTRRPIVHRNLKSGHILVEEGFAKLVDFSLSIMIPPGASRVEDGACGTMGFLEPEYFASGFVTKKSDVFGFGVTLLALLTGKRALDRTLRLENDENNLNLVDYVNAHKDRFKEIVDPRILREGGGLEQMQQLQAFLALALRCTAEAEDRPEMIDVAKELREIEAMVVNPYRPAVTESKTMLMGVDFVPTGLGDTVHYQLPNDWEQFF